MAHYFLWTYTKNADLLGSRFKVCERNSRGKPLWTWIGKIAALKEKKIIWDSLLTDPDKEIFAVSIDGVDFCTWEKKHPLYNIDKKQCSQKFRHCAAKYLIALSVYRPKCVFIAGPFRGGKGDLEIFQETVREKLAATPSKKAIVDRGYMSSLPEDSMLSYPDKMDPKELDNFKNWARLRQETFNGRLKFYSILNHTFEHGFDKHKVALEAVAVTVQYQMDNGSPIYAV